MTERTCQFEEETTFAEYPSLWTPEEGRDRMAAPPPPVSGHRGAGGRAARMGRRGFLKRAAVSTAALTAADFLRYFLDNGIPNDSRAYAMASRAKEAAGEPRFACCLL